MNCYKGTTFYTTFAWGVQATFWARFLVCFRGNFLGEKKSIESPPCAFARRVGRECRAAAGDEDALGGVITVVVEVELAALGRNLRSGRPINVSMAFQQTILAN